MVSPSNTIRRCLLTSFNPRSGLSHQLFGQLLGVDVADVAVRSQAELAVRNLDRAGFLGELDERQLTKPGDVAVGEPMRRSLRRQHVTYENIRHVRRSMAEEVRKCFGEDVLADAAKKPQWWGDLHAERERSACRVH